MNIPAPKISPDAALGNLLGAALDVPVAPEQPVAPDDTLARTGNTARDQEMYAAGIEVGEANAKHNAAIRAGVPAGWKLVPIEPTETMLIVGRESKPDPIFTPAAWDSFNAMTGCEQGAHLAKLCYAAMLDAAPAAPGVSTVENGQALAWMDPDTQDVINADRKASWLADFGAGAAAKAASYTRALGDLRPAPAAGDALDAARWRAYARLFPEISASFLATHGVDGGDPLPTIKGASITGGYVVVTPAGWDADKATKLRDAILRLFPVNPAHTPRPSDELAAQRKGGA